MLHRLSLLLAALLASSAAVSAQSSVWRVSRGGQSFYLGGTCHLLRATDFPLPAEFDQAFAASATVVFETDIDRLRSSAMQNVVLEHGMMPAGKSLEQLLTPAAWKKLEAYCAQSGLPLSQASHFRPWLLMSAIALTELQKIGVSTTGVDAHYFEKAGEARKKTGELETFEQQVNHLIHLGEGYESEMILQTIEDVQELPEAFRKIIAAWKTGDVAQIDALFLSDMRTKHPQVFKALMVERNNAWLPKLEAMLKTPETEFVLVGAGHLAGPEGLLAQLKQRGCAVEQLRARPAAK